MPPLKECFLRKDFNFSRYLGYAYGKTLKLFFNSSWISMLILLIVVDLFRLTNFSKDDWSTTYINFIIPVLFLIVFFAYYAYFAKIEKVLYP
jgi:hypothetical protein